MPNKATKKIGTKAPAKKVAAKKAAAKKAVVKKSAAKKIPAKKVPAKKAPAAKKTATPSVPLADWTLLVYIAGDNNLDAFGKDDLYEMKKVGSSDRLHLIAQRDTATAGAGTLRYRLRQGTELDQDLVEDLGETNTGDPAILQEFLEWGLKTYPAKRTMAVLWNHGSGWDDRDIYAEARKRGLDPVPPSPLPDGTPRAAAALPRAWTVNRGTSRGRNRGSFFLSKQAFATVEVGGQRRAIAFDDDAQDFLDSVEMKNVFNAVTAGGRKFDVIGMDACLMSMIEVGMQVKQAGVCFCGSQELEPPQGWPYDRILSQLAADPTMDGRSLCQRIVQEFVDCYHASEVVTQSAFELGKLGDVQEAVDDLGAFLAKGFAYDDDAVISAVDRASRKVQRYETVDYADLSDFCGRLAHSLPSAEALCREVQEAVAACVFATNSPHEKVKASRGLSIYLPLGRVSPLYRNLDSAQGGWAKFLDARQY